MAVFVDELVDWSLLTPEVLGSNLVIGKKIKHLETVNYIEKWCQERHIQNDFAGN